MPPSWRQEAYAWLCRLPDFESTGAAQECDKLLYVLDGEVVVGGRADVAAVVEHVSE